MKPSPRLLLLIGAWFLLQAVFLWLPEGLPWGGVFAAAVVLLATVDLVTALFDKPPAAKRTIAASLLVGRTAEVVFEITDLPRRLSRVSLHDGLPAAFSSRELPLKLAAPAREGLRARYRCTPERRGDHSFAPAWISWPSRLGLWERSFRCGGESAVRVFPLVKREERGGWELFRGQAQGTGLRSVRRRGHGLEFHQLREFREGDLKRLVDWKATSRAGKLIVREFQEEQNQEIVFLLDTGYRMFAKDGKASHFDRALESLLGLADTALRQGDRVGVMTFGPDSRWIQPVRGPSSLERLRSALYDLEACPAASSPSAALEKLLGLLRRRSLVVLMSNLREEDGEGLSPQLPLLLSRHVLLTLWIRESIADQVLQGPFTTLDEALTAAAAHRYLEDRASFQAVWQKRGVLIIDTRAESLGTSLINTYWRIKKQGRL